jgi:ATP-binding cassette, subfamily B, bacterial
MSATFQDEDDGPLARGVDLALWRRLLVHAAPYRADAVGMAVSGVAIAAADTALPLVTAELIDRAVAGADMTDLWPLAVAYLGCFAVIAFVVFAFIVFAGRISTGVAHDLRNAGFAKLQELPFSFYDTRPIGWLVARLTSDVGKVAGLLPWVLLDAVWGSCLLRV